MRGPLFILGGIGLFGLLDANSKLLSADYDVRQVLLVRFATILLAVAVMRMLVPRWGGSLSSRYPRLQALRAVIMLGSATFFFLAFSRLPLAEGYLVFFTAPFLTLLFSALILKERPPSAAWLWCLVGFLGVAIGVAPRLGSGGAMEGYLFAALGTLCYGGVFTLNRYMRGEPGFVKVLVWPALFGLVVMLPLGLMEWRPLTALALAQMVANGVMVGAATVFLAEAFRHANAARLAPFEFSGLVWGISFDLLIWGLWPALSMLAGAAVVVFACVMSERAAHGKPAGKA